MERRKASPEQLNLLLNFLEADKDLAVGKYRGLEGRTQQTNAWIKITEKLNANSGFGSGAIKTPDKWQQTWRDWKSNVKKKAFKIRKSRYTPGYSYNSQLTDAEEKIIRLICTNTAAFGLSKATTTHENGSDPLGNSDASSSAMKWPPEDQHYTQTGDGGFGSGDGNIEIGIDTSKSTAGGNSARPSWKRGRAHRFTHDRLLILEEEKIKIEKQKLLEKKRCNNIRLKLEKDKLEIERQRNTILEKLLVAVETVAQRQGA